MRFYAHPVDLPDDLIKDAKAAPVLRGISLKTYITEALSRYRGSATKASGKVGPAHVQLPLIGSCDGPKFRPTNEDLEQALAENENLRPLQWSSPI